MWTRLFGALLVGFVGLLGATQMAAQFGGGPEAQVERTCSMIRDYPEFHTCAQENMHSYQPPLTPDGKPDLNGIWRPTRIAQDIEELPNWGMRTIIVDPLDGKIPYKPWAMAQRFANEQIYLSPTAVCLPVAQPRWSYSPVSPTGHRIIQQPDRIVFSMERLHTYRVIHMDDRPRLPEGIHLWQGDSHGRWEGNTLVIQTKNLNDLMWMDHIGTFMSNEVTTEERITFVDENTLHYQQTITDPNTYTQPWTIALAFTRALPEDPVDLMDLEDTTVENCEEELVHMMNVGQIVFPGFDAIVPR